MKRFLIYVPYVLVTAAIMLPLLPPGYILTLDLVFTPSLRMPSEIGSDYLWYALLHFLDVILPSQLIEKVILVSIPLLASVGMHRLLVHVPMGASLTSRRLNRSGAGKQSFETTDSKVGSPLVSGLREVSEAPSKQWVLAIYAASIFYAVNPFTYSRFMAGQYAVLLGYALLPFFALALIRFLTAPSYLHTLKLTGLALVISIISIHTLGDLLLITVVALGVAIWQHKKGTGYKKYLKFIAIGLGLFVLLSSYWMIPAATGRGEDVRMVQGFDTSHARAFATVGGNTLERIINILDLQGFWAEGRNLFILPQDRVVGWGTVRLLVWILVGIGAVACWRSQRSLAIGLSLLATSGTILALGFPQNILTTIGYREPHKFTALVAFVFAILLAYGIAHILAKANRRSETRYCVTAVIVLLIILLFTPTMYWGFNGQITPRQYPESWQVVNARLNQDTSDFKTLFLPWHQYIHFSFAGRIIGNPATEFFDKTVLTSHDPELDDIRPQLSREERAIVEIFKKRHEDSDEKLARQGVKYIILAKENNYTRFSHIYSQKTLRILTDTPEMTLYLNTSYKENR